MVFVRFDKHGRVFGWLGCIFNCFNFIYVLCERPSHSFQGNLWIFLFLFMFCSAESEWSEVSEQSTIFSMQGRRPGNEDRAVMKQVEMIDGLESEGDSVHFLSHQSSPLAS